MTKRVYILTDEQRDAILASLRHWQAEAPTSLLLLEVLTNDGQHEGLSDAEIDDLCEIINGGDVTEALAPAIEAAHTYLDDLITGLADGTYDQDPGVDQIQAAINLYPKEQAQ